MATSNVARGNRYKRKTKDWYQARGYYVDYCEHVQSIFTPRGVIYVKKDLIGADGLSMNGKEIIFWNSKCTFQEKNNFNEIIKKGKEEFAKYPFPPFVKRVLVIWEPRKQPIFIDC